MCVCATQVRLSNKCDVDSYDSTQNLATVEKLQEFS